MSESGAIFWLYARYRLHGYLAASGRALLRHWQWLLLVALLVPGLPVLPLFAGAAQGLDAILAPGTGVGARLALVAALAMLAAGWALLQRQGLRGGRFRLYAATLPIEGWRTWLVDLAVLIVADGFGLVAFAIAGTGAGDAARATGLVLLLAASLALQMLVLCVAPARGRFLPAKRLRLPPALGVQLGVLGTHRLSVTLRLLTVAAIAWGASTLIGAFDEDVRALPVALVAAALIALTLSGLFRLLQQGHAAAGGYLAALPLPASYWPLRDSCLVLLLGAIAMSPLLTALRVAHAASAPALAWLLAGGLALLLALRWPALAGGRFAPFLGALLAGGWAGVAIAAVLR